MFCFSALKVTSKGAGLNPNAKVWQEMPVASSEVVPSSPHWPPSDISEGETQQAPAQFNIGHISLAFRVNFWELLSVKIVF